MDDIKKELLMAGFELQISGLGSNPSTNCATSNGLHNGYFRISMYLLSVDWKPSVGQNLLKRVRISIKMR